MSGFLLPDDSDPLTHPFWEGARRGELLMQRFTASGHYCWPPRPMDPVSRTLEYEWVPLSGRGTVWSIAIPHPPLLPAYTDLAPYNVVVVELEEDPHLRMVGNVVASADAPLNSVDPHSVQIGDPVQVVFAPVEDMVLPRWVKR
ncbi:MAG: OB-fold domain-containing protein [Actinomycetes bacterium]